MMVKCKYMDDQKPTIEAQNPPEPTQEPKGDNLQNTESAKNGNSDEITETPEQVRVRQNANLKPFKAGEPSPNPKGRPKGILNFSTRLNMAIDRLAHEYAQQHNKKFKEQIAAGIVKPIDEDDVDIMGDIFAKYVNAARNGDLKTAKDLLDRSYGRAIQKVEVRTPPTEAEIKAAQAEAEAWERLWNQPTTGEPQITEEEQSRQDDIQEDSTSMEEKLEALSEPT